MSARMRVYVLVVVAAVAAAGGAVGVTLATRTPTPAAAKKPAGRPPLALDLGLRTDAEAKDLARAQQLLDAGKAGQAEAIFVRHDSLEARVGAALAAWPNGSVAKLLTLAADNPKSALVQLHLGLAAYWDGRPRDAAQAWAAARADQPDGFYGVRADGLLHPSFLPGLPRFTPGFGVPKAIAKLPAAQQLAALKRAAAKGDARDLLLYGVALQQLDRPLSAEQQFARAARAAPDDPEALTAAAVGLFDKSDPSKAFSRLGPLSQRFPTSATVRFHLGLMLVWMEQLGEAKTQFEKAIEVEPGSPMAVEAKRFLDRLGNVGTK